MSETRRVIFGGSLVSRSTLMAAVDGFCFVPALPKWVSGSGSASVAVTEPSPFLRYRQVVQRFRRWTSNTRVGVRGVPLALAKLNAVSSARRGARRMTAATAGGVSVVSSIPPGGAPVEPGGGVIAGDVALVDVHRVVGLRPEHLERGGGRVPGELAQVRARGDQRLDAVPGVGAADVGLREEQALVGAGALGRPREVRQHRHVGLVAVDDVGVGRVGDVDDRLRAQAQRGVVGVVGRGRRSRRTRRRRRAARPRRPARRPGTRARSCGTRRAARRSRPWWSRSARPPAPGARRRSAGARLLTAASAIASNTVAPSSSQ